MAFIEINNDDIQVLIDDEYENYVLAGQFTVTMGEDSALAEGYGYANYQGHADSQPVVAVLLNPGDAPAMPTSIVRNASNVFTIKMNTFRAYTGVWRATILVFDRPASQGTGLVIVRNATGKVTFDSDQKYMRVVGQFSATGDMSMPLDGNVKYALVYASPWLRYSRFYVRWPNGMEDWGAQHDSLLAQCTTTSLALVLRMTYYRLGGAAALPPGWGDFATLSPGNYMLLDVTNQV